MKNHLVYYFVLLINIFSCLSISSQCQLTVLPDTSIKVCYGDSLVLIAQNTSSSSFTWSPNAFLDVDNNDTVVFYSQNPGNFSLKVVSIDSSGCSDSIDVDITVFDQFSTGNLDSVFNLCSQQDSGIIGLSQSPIGDNNFNYSWLSSNDGINFSLLSSPDTSILIINNIDTSFYYSVVVSSINGCGVDTTNILDLNYYAPFQIGTIFGTDTLCRYYPLDTIYQSSLTSGGSENYTYTWLSSFDGVQWNAIANANNSFYLPGGLTQNTFFSLNVNDLCGTDTTNVLFDSILPSPIVIDIQGDSVFCANQHDNFFWINETLPNISYDWQITGGSIFQQISDSALAVDMDDVTGNVNIQLIMTHNQTGCEVLVDKTVITTANLSPNRTQVIRKPNSDILVCDDSTENLIYQWGFTEKSSGTDTDISGANLRYVLLPHTFDSTTYRYWVRTSFDYGSGESCETLSYLGASPITGDELFNVYSDLKPYPNPTSGIFNLPYKEIQSVQLTDQFARSYKVSLSNKENNSTIDLSTLNAGVYFITVNTRVNSFVFTLIKQQ